MFENLDRAKMNGDALYVVLIEKHECKNSCISSKSIAVSSSYFGSMMKK